MALNYLESASAIFPSSKKIRDLFDKSNYNGPNPIKQGEKEKALREIQRLNDCIFPVEEIVLSSEDNSLLKIEKFGSE